MYLRRFLFALLFASPLLLHAQSTEADLQSRLIHKPIYLRGFWNTDTLHFDGSGKLLGVSGVVSFTLCGVEVTGLHLKNDALVLDATRMGLELKDTTPKRVPLRAGDSSYLQNEQMRITIDLPQNSDYGAALNAIFSDSLADLVPSLPAYWRSYGEKAFLPNGTPAPTVEPDPFKQQTLKTVGKTVKPPQLLKSAEPVFPDAAGRLRYTAVVLVGLIVEQDGSVVYMRMEKPAGLGLDEEALRAVQQYKFKPATENGVPVRMRLNVQVAFSIPSH